MIGSLALLISVSLPGCSGSAEPAVDEKAATNRKERLEKIKNSNPPPKGKN